jgi:hypothetical protein
VVVALAAAGCKNSPSRLDHLSSAAVTVDGELHEPAWNVRATRGVFTANGRVARPWSEIRVLHDDTSVFIALYAADEDIRSTDAFELVVGAQRYHLAAGGMPAFAALDVDGTLDQPTDDDEEWVVELALPRAGLPEPVPIEASRCDTPKDGQTRCSRWTGSVALTP